MTDQAAPPDRDAANPPSHVIGAEPEAPDGVIDAATPPPPPERPRRPVAPVLTAIGFLLLAGAVGYLWQQQQQQQLAAGPDAGMQALQSQLQSLDDRVKQLEQRPAPQASATAPAELRTLANRVQALEQRPAPDAGQLETRIAKLEQQTARLEQQTASTSQLSGRLDALAQQLQAATGQDQQAGAAMKQRLDTDETRLATLEQNAGQLGKLTDRVNRLAQLRAAELALSAGRPLGDIAGAPPALARYATEKPPTEAALRLAFPAAERAALAASTPDTEGKPFLSRVLARAEDLVTVRQGEHVLVGDASAGILARARAALNAGDLPAAVGEVTKLSGPPAQAMADWLAQANALLAARAALADQAAHS